MDRVSNENGKAWKEDQAYSLNATDRHAVACNDIAGTLDANYYKFDRVAYNQGKNAQYDFSIEEDKAQTVVAKGPGGVMVNEDIQEDSAPEE